MGRIIAQLAKCAKCGGDEALSIVGDNWQRAPMAVQDPPSLKLAFTCKACGEVSYCLKIISPRKTRGRQRGTWKMELVAGNAALILKEPTNGE